jgi:hypothetical protein
MSSFSNHDLLDACKEPGCPICRLGAQTVRRYMRSLFYENVNDLKTRDIIVKSLGFCGEHTRLLLSARIADGLGNAIIYEHLVKVVLRELPKNAAAGKPADLAKRLRRFISGSDGLGQCPVCTRRAEIVDYNIIQISRSLDNETLRLALEASDGFCFLHLAQTLERTPKPADIDFLLTLTRQKLETRQAELAEVIRKNDHHNRGELITDEEALAWKKAASLLGSMSITPTGERFD